MTEILMQAVPVHPTNPKAIWCEHCEVWCRSESAFIHHKKGRKHLQPKITVDHIYNIMFGVDIIKNHEKEKDWKAAIKAMLKKKREMKLNAKSLYKKYGKKRATNVSSSPSVTTTSKVLLYYKYIDIENLDGLHEWQKALGGLLNLCGRIRIGKEGINGTISGSDVSIMLYIEAMKYNIVWKSFFNDIDFKESNNNNTNNAFSNFWVRQCKEIVVMGQDPDVITANNGGIHLKPKEFHEQLLSNMNMNLNNNDKKNKNPNQEVALLDVRNLYESAIGTMKGAIRLPTRHFSEFPKIADKLIEQENLKNKNVYMYCTGGIRCERASAYLISKGVQNCFQLEGGIHRYVEQLGKDGLFQGKNFVFDRRISSERVGDNIIGKCTVCKIASVDKYVSDYTCDKCGVWILVCTNCQENLKHKKRKLNHDDDRKEEEEVTTSDTNAYYCEYCLIHKSEN